MRYLACLILAVLLPACSSNVKIVSLPGRYAHPAEPRTLYVDGTRRTVWAMKLLEDHPILKLQVPETVLVLSPPPWHQHSRILEHAYFEREPWQSLSISSYVTEKKDLILVAGIIETHSDQFGKHYPMWLVSVRPFIFAEAETLVEEGKVLPGSDEIFDDEAVFVARESDLAFKISKLHILQGEFPDREESYDDWMPRVRTIEFEQPITLKEVLDGYEQWAKVAKTDLPDG